VLLSRTVVGRYWYHIGGNEEAARLSGAPVPQGKLLAFLASGALAGFAAALHTARSASGQPLAGAGLELSSIAASVLGGTSLRGGEGRPIGVLFGVLIFAITGNGLTLLGFSSYLQLMVTGAIFILAVWLDLRGQPTS
jgi:ribose transport system permease protein